MRCFFSFQLDFGRGANLDDGDATGQLGQTLLQLLTVVVRVGVLNLGLDLVDAALDVVLGTGSFDDGRLILGHDDLSRAPQHLDVGGLELETDLFGDDGGTGQIAMSWSMALRRSPNPGPSRRPT